MEEENKAPVSVIQHPVIFIWEHDESARYAKPGNSKVNKITKL